MRAMQGLYLRRVIGDSARLQASLDGISTNDLAAPR